jgi:hypothetical protein
MGTGLMFFICKASNDIIKTGRVIRSVTGSNSGPRRLLIQYPGEVVSDDFSWVSIPMAVSFEFVQSLSAASQRSLSDSFNHSDAIGWEM